MKSTYISIEEYNKIANFFKKHYRERDIGILNFVDVFSPDDLAQEYYFFRLSNKDYKTPKEFYDKKVRDAFTRKRILLSGGLKKEKFLEFFNSKEELTNFISTTPVEHVSHDKEIAIENTDCKFSLSKASKTDDEKTLDLCIIGLGEVLKGFSYHIEKILSHRGLTENERYYLNLALDSLLNSSSNSLNFTETELLNIASESLRKNSAEELFNLEDRIKDLESNYAEFLSEDGVFLLKVCKMILSRDKTEYLLHPATKEEVGEMKHLPESLTKELSKKDVFKMTFLDKCHLAEKTEEEIKLISFINKDRDAYFIVNDREFIDFSYEEIFKLTKERLIKIPELQLYNLSHKDIKQMLGIPVEEILQYESFEEEINKVI